MEELKIKLIARVDMLAFVNDWRLQDWIKDGDIEVDYDRKERTVTIRFAAAYDRMTYQAVTDLLNYYVFYN